jgi:hypothetical protein
MHIDHLCHLLHRFNSTFGSSCELIGSFELWRCHCSNSRKRCCKSQLGSSQLLTQSHHVFSFSLFLKNKKCFPFLWFSSFINDVINALTCPFFSSTSFSLFRSFSIPSRCVHFSCVQYHEFFHYNLLLVVRCILQLPIYHLFLYLLLFVFLSFFHFFFLLFHFFFFFYFLLYTLCTIILLLMTYTEV